MAQVWSTVRPLVVGGDTYRIYSHILNDGFFTWYSPLLGIGGEVPWKWFQEIPEAAIRTVIDEFLVSEGAPA